VAVSAPGAQAPEHFRPGIGACYADHPQEATRAEAEPLHDHDVGPGPGVFGLSKDLVSRLTANAKRTAVLQLHFFDSADLAESHPGEIIALAGLARATRHCRDEQACLGCRMGVAGALIGR